MNFFKGPKLYYIIFFLNETSHPYVCVQTHVSYNLSAGVQRRGRHPHRVETPPQRIFVSLSASFAGPTQCPGLSVHVLSPLSAKTGTVTSVTCYINTH